MDYEKNTEFIKKMLRPINTVNSHGGSINLFFTAFRIQTALASSGRASQACRHFSLNDNTQYRLRPNNCAASICEEISGGLNKSLTKENFEQLTAALAKNDPCIVAVTVKFRLTAIEMNGLYKSISNNTELGYISWHETQFAADDKILQQIESKLIENNRNYRHHPNDYTHGLLSKHAYKDSACGSNVTLDPTVDEHLKNWKVEKVYPDTQVSGYYAAIYINHTTHQVVLAIRGTEGGVMDTISSLLQKNSDWKTNFEEILGNQIVVGQQARNLQATEEAIEIAKNAGYRLSFTGHSLGAWLAELSAFYSYAFCEYYDIKAVTFDSPGTLPMMEKLQSNNINDRVKLEDLDIVTYLAHPNPANCCNSHVGRVYKVDPLMKMTKRIERKMPASIKNTLGDKIKPILAIEGHDLWGILTCFNPKTGKPTKCQTIRDWPRIVYKGDQRTFSQKGQEIAGAAKRVAVAGVNTLTTLAATSAGVPPIASAAIGAGVGYRVNWGFDYYIINDNTLMSIIGVLISGLREVIANIVPPRAQVPLRLAIDYMIGEGTVELVDNALKKDINQEQYWKYYEHIDFKISNEDEKSPEKRMKIFDERFELIALVKYREGKNVHELKLITDSVDKYLYKLFEFKEKLGEREDILPIVKTQLEELLASFKINRNGPQKILIPNPGYDIDDIRQRTQRLLQVIPKDIRKVWQKEGIEHTIMEMKQSLIKELPDNLPFAAHNYKEIHGKKEELQDKFSKNAVVLISGAGGMGKSTLAENWGRDRMQENWQVRWIKGTEIEEEFFQLARELHIIINRLHLEAIRDEVYGVLARLKKKVLLIFDNVEEEEKIKPFLKNLPNCIKVIITSRNVNLLEGIGIKTINVNGFSKQEAISYLKMGLEQREKGRSEKEIEKEAGRLVKIVRTSPFRLSKIVAYLNAHPFQSIDQFLEEYKAIKMSKIQNEEIYPEVEILFRDLKNRFPKSWLLLKYLAYLDMEGTSSQFIGNLMTETQANLEGHVYELEKLSLINVVKNQNKTVLKLSHKIVQDETKKALIEEDKGESQEILKKLIMKLKNPFQCVKAHANDQQSPAEWSNHARMLLREAKKVNLNFTGREELLFSLGNHYDLADINYKEAIYYWEELLNYYGQLRNHLGIALGLHKLGDDYLKLGDTNKGLECMKQAYSIYLPTFGKEDKSTKEIRLAIEPLQPNFKEIENRLIIVSRGEASDILLTLKQKIQENVLNSIVRIVDDQTWCYKHGWSSLSLGKDWGVKGYLEKDYLKRQLGELGNNDDNVEMAQMLCFEAMNLGVMKSENRSYEVVKDFTKANPELVIKIAKQHPEFFVDGSIVDACSTVLSYDRVEHILKHITYLGTFQPSKL